MNVSREELLHIAKLADLNIKDNEVDEYLKNFQEILEFTNIINKLNTENISETIGSTSNKNVFREDEVKVFGDRELLLQNAPDQEEGMFKIPKVIN